MDVVFLLWYVKAPDTDDEHELFIGVSDSEKRADLWMHLRDSRFTVTKSIETTGQKVLSSIENHSESVVGSRVPLVRRCISVCSFPPIPLSVATSGPSQFARRNSPHVSYCVIRVLFCPRVKSTHAT